MPAGRERQEYVDAFERGVDVATAGFVPDLVMISAGFDSLAGDPLGGFTLEVEHVEQLTRDLVARATDWCGGRVVRSLAGGHAPPRPRLARVRHTAGFGGGDGGAIPPFC